MQCYAIRFGKSAHCTAFIVSNLFLCSFVSHYVILYEHFMCLLKMHSNRVLLYVHIIHCQQAH